MDRHMHMPADESIQLTNCEECNLLQPAGTANAHLSPCHQFVPTGPTGCDQKCLLPVVLYLLRVLLTPVTTKCAISADETPGGNGLP